MKISDKIRERIQKDSGGFLCNQNISEYIHEGELELLTQEVTTAYQSVLESLVIDTQRDHNTRDTASRVARMMIQEIFAGRYEPHPKVTSFPNVTAYDQLYVVGPITIRSTCAHHFQNIIGRGYVGVFPGENVIGLSKFNRIVDWICSRPTIQEEMTVQIADAIETETLAAGVAVLIQAEHHCMIARGVKEHESAMTTSVMRGVFKTETSLKQEFMSIVAKMP